jgi:hypothetical protein
VEWVNVQTGESDNKLTEVFGDVHAGDAVATQGTDELRSGTRVTAKETAPNAPGPSK